MSYPKTNYELSRLLEAISKEEDTSYSNPFISHIIDFTKSINYQEDTTYVFLFRDTILPYLAFQKLHSSKPLAWVIGRKFLSQYSSTDDEDEVYDQIHEAIFDTLSENHSSKEEFFPVVEGKIREMLNSYPELLKDLKALLDSIKTKHIMVIESGYIGSIPVLLKCLDERVDFYMYTTVPYFYEAYQDSIYTKHFEECRLFETIQTADALFEFSSYHDGKFFMHKTDDSRIIEQSKKEVSYLYSLLKHK